MIQRQAAGEVRARLPVAPDDSMPLIAYAWAVEGARPQRRCPAGTAGRPARLMRLGIEPTTLTIAWRTRTMSSRSA